MIFFKFVNIIPLPLIVSNNFFIMIFTKFSLRRLIEHEMGVF